MTMPGPISSQPYCKTENPTVTIHGWAMREMAPWLLQGVDGDEARGLFDYLNSCEWATLYHFSNGQVSMAPKPGKMQVHIGFITRSLQYMSFFSEIAKILPANFRTTICVSLGDGPPNMVLRAPVFNFQKKCGGRDPLLPDVDFLTNGFYSTPECLDNLPYGEKLPGAVFAGSTTGGEITLSVARDLSLPRLRAAGFFQGNERVDFRLPQIVQVTEPEAQALLQTMPFCRKPFLSWKEQLRRRFILSIDGNGATCSRVLITLLSNSVLLKYDSDNILYYFGGMQPWVHYVPVARDSDVEKTIDLEARDPARFEQIAAADREFALTYLSQDRVYEYTKILLMLYAKCVPDILDTALGHAPQTAGPSRPFSPKVLAHLQNIGDTESDSDGWAGVPGSGLAIEGFAIGPEEGLPPAGFSYQAVKVDGALSEPAQAGEYCGTRGKGMPVIGLRLLVDDDLAGEFHVTCEAQFVDGSRIGPLPAAQVCCALSNAPLEAFRVHFLGKSGNRTDGDRAN